ncbi:MAG: hypothetical protein ABFD82_16260 [Syntrophaceae bacterium]
MKRFFHRLLSGENRILYVGCVTAIFLILMSGAFVIWKAFVDPDITFLYSEQGAQWVRFREQTKLKIRWPQTLVSVFRTHFEVKELPNEAVLHFRALKLIDIWLDDQLIFHADPSLVHEWKKDHCVDLISVLTPGVHDLRIAVKNQNGHPALIAYCKSLRLFTSDSWEVSIDGKTWTKALPVNETPTLPLSRNFQRADYALISNLHLYAPLFIIVFMLSLLSMRFGKPCWLFRFMPTTKSIRWILLVMWVIMAINNITKIPLDMGMDIKGHIQYIKYIVDNMHIPLATDGWQMFQPPLFYIISACIYKFSLNFFSEEIVLRILRILPLLCGLAQIELCYRAIRYIYPSRDDLQILGMIIGGFLPMNLYMSQVVGTEPLSALLSGIVIILILRFFHYSNQPSVSFFILMGAILGLSILTKITAILLIPPFILSIAYIVYMKYLPNKESVELIVQHIILFLGVTCIISGWFFIRNWIEMGQVFVTSSMDVSWWQDPGYRTPRQFMDFGEALYYPVYSSVISVWDGLYSTLWMDGYLSAYNRPPWNYGFMLSSAWLSLLPSCAIILGTLSVLIKPNRPYMHGRFYVVSCLIIYISAILYIFLSVPFLSTAKATYALGITPCIAILCAEGFEIITRNPISRAIFYGGIACWAVASYAAYFVL